MSCLLLNHSYKLHLAALSGLLLVPSWEIDILGWRCAVQSLVLRWSFSSSSRGFHGPVLKKWSRSVQLRTDSAFLVAFVSISEVNGCISPVGKATAPFSFSVFFCCCFFFFLKLNPAQNYRHNIKPWPALNCSHCSLNCSHNSRVLIASSSSSSSALIHENILWQLPPIRKSQRCQYSYSKCDECSLSRTPPHQPCVSELLSSSVRPPSVGHSHAHPDRDVVVCVSQRLGETKEPFSMQAELSDGFFQL